MTLLWFDMTLLRVDVVFDVTLLRFDVMLWRHIVTCCCALTRRRWRCSRRFFTKLNLIGSHCAQSVLRVTKTCKTHSLQTLRNDTTNAWPVKRHFNYFVYVMPDVFHKSTQLYFISFDLPVKSMHLSLLDLVVERGPLLLHNKLLNYPVDLKVILTWCLVIYRLCDVLACALAALTLLNSLKGIAVAALTAAHIARFGGHTERSWRGRLLIYIVFHCFLV